MTKVEATQLKAAARHLKSVSSRKEADKMVAKVPPVGWAGGIRFGAEFKRMKRMNEIDIQEKSLKKKMIWVSEFVYYTTFVRPWVLAKLRENPRIFADFRILNEELPGKPPHLTDFPMAIVAFASEIRRWTRLCIKPKKSGLRITSCTSCHLYAA